jgi:pseudouridine synthase
MPETHLVRLNRLLADVGVTSRRQAARLIAEGRVAVNGVVVSQPAAMVGRSVALAVDGRLVPTEGAPELQYAVFHKPTGYLTTRSDPSGRPTILDALPDEFRHLSPVGRLDKDTSGLLLLTNDGVFSQEMTHPGHAVAKTYIARVEGYVSDADMARLRAGVQLTDGVTRPAESSIMERGPASTTISLSVREGRHRQVRRMVRAIGSRVLDLARVRIGPLQLGDLPPGHARWLAEDEVRLLRAAAGPRNAPPGVSPRIAEV